MAKNKDSGREMVVCRRCNGNGFIKVPRAQTDSKGKVTTVQNDEPCGDCGASGRIEG
ncbi:Hypothetical protein AJAP_27850 [Amycolatopsis japonica]|uniref:Uncharacterized protein n=1 Tax=Amycolatopsis japonica TaxID=208439 RepID=A0A075V682_9PSEU|nr:Hypothetical protein AJAP_27850 [Amycolatopsis japonica]